MRVQRNFATGRLGNPSVLDRMDTYLEHLKENEGLFTRDLEGWTLEHLYVYRSSDVHYGHSYSRLNTCFWIFPDEPVSTLEGAQELLEEVGVLPVLEEKKGSAVLFAPLEKTWTAKDVQLLNLLMRAGWDCMSEAFGSFGRNYVLAWGKGADFFYNYLTTTAEVSVKIAGALVVGGSTQEENRVVNHSDFGAKTAPFSMTLFGAGSEVQEWVTSLFQGNTSSAIELNIHEETLPIGQAFRQEWPTFLSKRVRIPVGPGRNHFTDGETTAGVVIDPEEEQLLFVAHEDGQSVEGTQICRWYEVLPQERLEEKASVPLILLLHGNGDDPQSLLEQCGFLNLAAKERIAIVAPDHQEVEDLLTENWEDPKNKVRQLDRVVASMLERYPCLDASRVYVTGFSRGSMLTCLMALFDTKRFAAAAPLSGMSLCKWGDQEGYVTEKDWCRFDEKVSLPVLVYQCGRDSIFDDHLGLSAHLRLPSYRGDKDSGPIAVLNLFRKMNGLPTISEEDYDFDAYPFWGFPMEDLPAYRGGTTLYHRGCLRNDSGTGILEFAVGEGLEHALTFDYATLVWEFFRRFTRES